MFISLTSISLHLALLHVASAASNLSVTVKNGTYTGLNLPSFEQELFLGMPYAQPPLDNLRLAPPLSLNTTWEGTRNATEYSLICIGYPSRGLNDDLGLELSEDCLTVNVIRPTGVVEGSNVPVMLWI
jgi:carboxylesterase type B